MGNPYDGEFRSTRAAKMRAMGVEPTPMPVDRAHSFAPPVPAEQGDPVRAVREGKLLSRDPVEAVKQIYSPDKTEALPVRAGLPPGKHYGHQD